MTLIDLKFSPEMARATLEGRKCCTSRRCLKGVSGDIFEIEGIRFRIIDVMKESVSKIAYDLCFLEGFGGYRQCFETLRELYPGLEEGDYLYVHYFARCP